MLRIALVARLLPPVGPTSKMSAYGHTSRQKHVLLSVELVGSASPVDSVIPTDSVELVVFTASAWPVFAASTELLVSIAFAAVLIFLRGGIALKSQAVRVVILAFTLVKAEMVVYAVSAI